VGGGGVVWGGDRGEGGARVLHVGGGTVARGTYEPLPAGYSDDLKGLVASMLQVKPRRR
jgi:hypothetical protein